MAQKSPGRTTLPFLGILTLLSMLVFHDDSILLAIILCVLAVLSLSLYPSKPRFVLALVLFVAGACIEVIAVYSGIWGYPHPDMFGIPFWVPFMWVNGALAVTEFNESIRRRFRS